MDLWKKDSNKKDAMYVNIFKAQQYEPKWLKSVQDKMTSKIEIFKLSNPWQKDDTVAVEIREMGNSRFAHRAWHQAIQYYNESLCFAKPDSEHISLAYANRSACFYQMMLYDKCLIDIELAKKWNYPQRLMSKLDKRHDDCKKLINAGQSVQADKPKLSSDPNDQFSFLADSVRIDFHESRRIVATTDLSVGQTIFLEPPYIGETLAGKYKTCNICLSANENLIPCDGCTVAMFCNGKCKQNDLHRFECGIKKCAIVTNSYPVNIRMPLVRSIMMAVNNFPTIDALMEFVEKIMSNKTVDVQGLDEETTKYSEFLKMKPVQYSTDLIPVLWAMYKMMMKDTNIANVFNTIKYQRFLMHLILKHLLILNRSASFQDWNFANQNNNFKQYKAKIAFHLNLSQSLFEHSCAPNIAFVLANGFTSGIVMRPVKAGEQLFVIQSESLPKSYSERQKILQMTYGIQCKCELCEPQCSALRSNRNIATNSDFQFALQCCREQTPNPEILITVLNKFGRKRWCRELDMVYTLYALLYRTQALVSSNDEIPDHLIDWDDC